MKRFYIPLKLSTAQMLYYFESHTKQLLTYYKDQGVPVVPLCTSTVWVSGLLLMAAFSNKIIFVNFIGIASQNKSFFTNCTFLGHSTRWFDKTKTCFICSKYCSIYT